MRVGSTGDRAMHLIPGLPPIVIHPTSMFWSSPFRVTRCQCAPESSELKSPAPTH
jgi:hypothetical protein